MSAVSAAIAATGALASGILGAKGYEKAGERGGAATDAAIQYQKEMFDKVYNDPFNAAARQQGLKALDRLSGNVFADKYEKPYTTEDFKASPVYNALTNAYKDIGSTMSARAAATGMLGSGNMQSTLQLAGQQAASQYEPLAFDQHMQQQQMGDNALAGLTGVGQQQMNALTGLGGQSAANIGNWLMQGGHAQGQMDLSRYLTYANMLGPIFQGLGNVAASSMGH